VTSPLVVPIADALAEGEKAVFGLDIDPADFIGEAEEAAAACIAVVAALPADYTAVDVLAFLRGDDVPSEPLPVVADRQSYDCCEHCPPDAVRATGAVAWHDAPCRHCGQGGAA